jgi:hypothetical protein
VPEKKEYNDFNLLMNTLIDGLNDAFSDIGRIFSTGKS